MSRKTFSTLSSLSFRPGRIPALAASCRVFQDKSLTQKTVLEFTSCAAYAQEGVPPQPHPGAYNLHPDSRRRSEPPGFPDRGNPGEGSRWYTRNPRHENLEED